MSAFDSELDPGLGSMPALFDEAAPNFLRGCLLGNGRYRATDDEARSEKAAERRARKIWGDDGFAEIERQMTDEQVRPGVRMVGVMVRRKVSRDRHRRLVVLQRLVHGVGASFQEAFENALTRTRD